MLRQLGPRVICVDTFLFFGLNVTYRDALSGLACARQQNLASLDDSLDFPIFYYPSLKA